MTGMSFSTPWFYSGLTFGGISSFVDCADELDAFHGICRSLKVCVIAGSTHADILKSILKGTALQFVNDTDQLDATVEAGICNVIAGEPPFLATLKQQQNPDWKLGASILSKEPLAMVTRDDDPEWTSLVNLVVDGLILAEARNITKGNVEKVFELFIHEDGSRVESELSTQIAFLVAEFGNYGDLYRTYIEDVIPRTKANKAHDSKQSTGLINAMPFGNLLIDGPGPITNGKMDVILRRGYLSCGIPTWRGAAFASVGKNANATDEESASISFWSGFDVEFCKGVAAALFAGHVDDKIEFIELKTPLDSFAVLSNNAVDVVAGARVSLQVQHLEPSTRQGYRFSAPYYFDTDYNNEPYALMTRKDDVQWSDLVNWVVMASIYAEEENITSSTSANMPVVSLYGVEFLQMFRDTIFVMGSFAEVWNSTLQSSIPRAGANLLNRGLEGPQLYPIPPF